tara:strand:+ start:22 stop:2145 length:2124 start_codon:yes stop_codon:yes gene_type:complete
MNMSDIGVDGEHKRPRGDYDESLARLHLFLRAQAPPLPNGAEDHPQKRKASQAYVDSPNSSEGEEDEEDEEDVEMAEPPPPQAITPAISPEDLEMFTIAVQKLTMGEAFNGSKPSDTEMRRYINPAFSGPFSLAAKIGPYTDRPVLKFSGDHLPYLWTTLPCVMKYLEKSVMTGVDGKVFFAHGGIKIKAEGKNRHDRFFPGLNYSLKLKVDDGNVLKVTEPRTFKFDAMEYPDPDPSNAESYLKELHTLSFVDGDSTITGRQAVPDPCLPGQSGKDAVKNHIPDGMVLAVYGHTPQWSALPMVAKNDNGSHLIVLDTQYTDRKRNTHALMTKSNGAFTLKGLWMDKVKYTARSEDNLIGTIVELEVDNLVEIEVDNHVFRVVCKIDEMRGNLQASYNPQESEEGDYKPVPKGEDEYLAVRYTNVALPDGKTGMNTEIMILKPTYDIDGNLDATADAEYWTMLITGTAETTEAKVTLQPNAKNIKSLGKKFKRDELSPPNPASKDISTPDSNFTIFCGDIEGSVNFLLSFLEHALAIAKEVDDDFPSLDKIDINTPDELRGMQKFGIIWEELDQRVKNVFSYTATLSEWGFKIGCMGDIVGDPTGSGAAEGMHFIDEFVCAYWAAHMVDDFFSAVGNRDGNKLRFIDEIIAWAMKANPDMRDAVADFVKGFAEAKGKEEKSILEANARNALKLCTYPVFYTGASVST